MNIDVNRRFQAMIHALYKASEVLTDDVDFFLDELHFRKEVIQWDCYMTYLNQIVKLLKN